MKTLCGVTVLGLVIFLAGEKAFAEWQGNSNTFYGANAGVNTADDNDADTFVGADAGASNTTGSNNTFVGKMRVETRLRHPTTRSSEPMPESVTAPAIITLFSAFRRASPIVKGRTTPFSGPRRGGITAPAMTTVFLDFMQAS